MVNVQTVTILVVKMNKVALIIGWWVIISVVCGILVYLIGDCDD